MSGIVKAIFGSPPPDSPLARVSAGFHDEHDAHVDMQDSYDKPTPPSPKVQPGHESPQNTTGVFKPSAGSSAKQTWQGVLAPGCARPLLCVSSAPNAS